MIEVYGYLGEPPAQVREACAGAGLVVASARALDALAVPDERRVVLGRVVPAIEALRAHVAGGAGAPAVVLASGDPLFYGVVRRFRAAGLECRVHPGVSSVQAAWASVGLPWDDAQVVSAHGHGIGPALAAARALPKVAVLTAPGQGVRELAAGLADLPRWFVLAERLGESDERVRVLTGEEARGLAADDVREPNVVLILDAPPESRAALGKPTAYVGGPRPASADLDDHPEQAGPEQSPPAHLDDALALVLGRHLPVLGSTLWTAGALVAPLGEACRRTGAAVVDLGAVSEADAGSLAEPDLVVLDDPRALARIEGRRPSAVVLIGTDDTAQACAAALDALGLEGGGRVEHVAVTAEEGRARSSYVVELRVEPAPAPAPTGHPGGRP